MRRRAPDPRKLRSSAAPYVTAQPIARNWYADVLSERKGAGDSEAAQAILQVSTAASDRTSLALYARLARQKLAAIA